MANLVKQLDNYRLVTAKILYHMPDHIHLLQEYVWQEYDMAPKYPVLRRFLDFWGREIEGKVHSVYVGQQTLITPGDYRFTAWQKTIQ